MTKSKDKQQPSLFDQDDVDFLPRPTGVSPLRTPLDTKIHNADDAKLITSYVIGQFENKVPKKAKKRPNTERIMSVTAVKGEMNFVKTEGQEIVSRPFFDGHRELGLALELVIRAAMAYFYHVQHGHPIETAGERSVLEMLCDNFRENLPNRKKRKDEDPGTKKQKEMAKAIYNNRHVFDDGNPGFLLRFFNRIYRWPVGHQIPLIGPRIAPDIGMIQETLPSWEEVIAGVVNHSEQLLFEYIISCIYKNFTLINHPIDIVTKDDDGDIKCIELKSGKYPLEPNISQLLEMLIIKKSAEKIDRMLGITGQRIPLSQSKGFWSSQPNGLGEIWYIGSAPDYGRIVHLTSGQEMIVYSALDGVNFEHITKAWK